LKPTPAKSLEVTMAHQMTHAAFVSPRPWIYEGLAHFAQAMARERQDGRRAAIAFMNNFLPALRAIEKSSGQPLVASSDEVLHRTKAMYVWWMLHDMLGDAPLQKALAAYRADEDKEPSYIQRLLQQASKRNLEWFFDDWVYRDRGLPDFRVDSAPVRALLAGEFSVAVTVENTGEVAAELPVTVRTASGDRSKRVFVKSKSKATERVQVPAQPTEVVINDGSVPEADTSNNSFPLPKA
jgi:hypothetical protein